MRAAALSALRGLLDLLVAVVVGERKGANPSDYERAGASWWLENLHDERGTLDDVLGIVLAGPRP